MLYKFMNGFVYGLYIKESQQILNDIAVIFGMSVHFGEMVILLVIPKM